MYVISPRAETSNLNIVMQSLLFYIYMLGLITLPALLGILFCMLQFKRWLLFIALIVVLFIAFAAERTLQPYLTRYILIGVIGYCLCLLYPVDVWQSR